MSQEIIGPGLAPRDECRRIPELGDTFPGVPGDPALQQIQVYVVMTDPERGEYIAFGEDPNQWSLGSTIEQAVFYYLTVRSGKISITELGSKSR